jgi:hypothetical protein
MEYQNLLNLDSIINSEVKTNPWQYKIIDDIIEKESFNKLKESVTHISNLNKNDEFYSDGIWPNEFESFDLNDEIYDIVIKCASEFLSIKDKLLLVTIIYQNLIILSTELKVLFMMKV